MQSNGENPPSFAVNFSLDDSKLPGDAAIYIEAYARNTLQRFHFGTVEEIVPPDDTGLGELDLSATTLFRIHIVDESEHIGRLIASADKLKPEGEDDEVQKSSLLVVRSRPMGNDTWRLDFATGDKPELCINSRIPNAIGQIKNNPVFQTLILPAALRQVLMFYLWDDNVDEGSMAEHWLNFAEQTASERPQSEDTTDIMNWIDEVVERFSNSFELCDMLLLKMEDS